MYHYFIDAPDGFGVKYIHIHCSDLGIRGVFFADTKLSQNPNSIALACAGALNRYFQGLLFSFDLPLDMEGSAFQKKVWKKLCEIKFGEIWSYKHLAIEIGSINYSRAVGGANSKNPIPIIVPCHRVIGNNGKLVGYAGGLALKEWLLNHEKKVLNSKI
ncbi:methylated-DNA--[protein]-cysteine S-methyltransferase [Helicobacter sp. 11S03491-1]|uniref:methylated-DNA--[protein]-cysteine S-methyltransferase n=1 Tax=Helicobacter sp. 11S03491-1 TaxID=1476196 RepID=UPI000BA5DEAD|nr:methylated-DNA--[protein]-cysteine S-methyltransferase [Helicobacter sp. 11S03491-1]PAF42601.1 cysteine methyltransferase [Helicobacter sp. 11S03491-1]